MSTTTTNLNLVKPEGTEYVDVDVINDNMDIIDAFAGTVSQKPSINSVELSGNKTSAQLLLADADHTHVMDDITDLPTVPTKTSDLTNDSNFVSDSNYVHTDANFTSNEKTKLSGIAYNANNYTLPIANTTTLGGIKPDGTTLSVDVNGVASVIGGGGGGGGTTVVANPAGEATDVLETIQIGTTVYEAGGSGTEELTLAQYNALTPEQKMLDIHYVITDVNGNADDYSSIQPIISDAYSSSSTYEVGDYVIRSNRLYKCNTAITEPENWNATKWTETKIADELGKESVHYSTEEQAIGTWADGKTVYRIVVTGLGNPQTSIAAIENAISDKNINVFTNIQVMVFASFECYLDNNVKINSSTKKVSGLSQGWYSHAILEYTKTTN